MKNSNEKLEHKLLHRIQMNFNMLYNFTKFRILNLLSIKETKTAFMTKINLNRV